MKLFCFVFSRLRMSESLFIQSQLLIGSFQFFFPVGFRFYQCIIKTLKKWMIQDFSQISTELQLVRRFNISAVLFKEGYNFPKEAKTKVSYLVSALFMPFINAFFRWCGGSRSSIFCLVCFTSWAWPYNPAPKIEIAVGKQRAWLVDVKLSCS